MKFWHWRSALIACALIAGVGVSAAVMVEKKSARCSVQVLGPSPDCVRVKRGLDGHMSPVLMKAILRQVASEKDVVAVTVITGGRPTAEANVRLVKMRDRYVRKAMNQGFDNEEAVRGWRLSVQQFVVVGQTGTSRTLAQALADGQGRIASEPARR